MEIWDSKLEALLIEFQKRFIPENNDKNMFTQEELDDLMLSVNENCDEIRNLVEKHVTPVYNHVLYSNESAILEYNELLNNYNNILNSNKATKNGTKNGNKNNRAKRRLSSWQIYLKYAKDLVPGYKESDKKMQLCKEHYKNLSKQDIEDLCKKYTENNYSQVEMQTATAQRLEDTQDRKKGKSGYNIFLSEWYKKQKQLFPEQKGLRAGECGKAWKALTESERQEYNAMATQPQ